jgi:hypothetical protein
VGELHRPQPVAPEWSRLQWQIAKSASAIHGISGLLAHSLRWAGPAHWRAFLEDQSRQVAGRLPRIQALLKQLDSAAASHGIALVALKGAALHALGLYGPGDRPMADIDLLAREGDAAALAAVLGRLGYQEAGSTWKHRAYQPVIPQGTPGEIGELASTDIKIELHTAIQEALPLRVVDISSAIFPVRPHPGLNPYPSMAAAMLHIMLHAAGAMVFRESRALHLRDIAGLCRHLSPADWEEVLELAAAQDCNGTWWIYPPLRLANRYFDCVPPRVMERALRACPRRLYRWYRDRTITEISYSRLWVSAFPGLEWARSAREIMTYVARRVRPSAETIAMRRAFALSQPQASGGEWSQTPQSQRILRWLLARQPRPATLHGVRAALKLPA